MWSSCSAAAWGDVERRSRWERGATRTTLRSDGVDVNDNQNAGLVYAKCLGRRRRYQGVNGNNNNVNAGFNAVLPIPLDSVQEFRASRWVAKAWTKDVLPAVK